MTTSAENITRWLIELDERTGFTSSQIPVSLINSEVVISSFNDKEEFVFSTQILSWKTYLAKELVKQAYAQFMCTMIFGSSINRHNYNVCAGLIDCKQRF